jgi:hypothetical protein
MGENFDPLYPREPGRVQRKTVKVAETGAKGIKDKIYLRHAMWRGLKPSLTEKLWSLKAASCDEFLREVRRYQEMTSRTRQEYWAIWGCKGSRCHR